jgi:hypothetical protein
MTKDRASKAVNISARNLVHVIARVETARATLLAELEKNGAESSTRRWLMLGVFRENPNKIAVGRSKVACAPFDAPLFQL